MRAFVFLLILANLLFLAWTQGFFGSPSNPDSLRIKQQRLADQVTIVSRDVPPGAPAKNEKTPLVAEKKEPGSCLRLTGLKADDAARVESALSGKFPDFKTVRTLSEGVPSYWVYIPPQDSRRDAEKKAAELKNHKIKDFFIIQEEGPNQFAISLGIFSTQAASEEHLGALRKKGVRSARAGERSVKPSIATLEMTGPQGQSEALRKWLVELLPGSKAEVCEARSVHAP